MENWEQRTNHEHRAQMLQVVSAKNLQDQQKLESKFVTAQKTIFSFSKYSGMMVFPRKPHWNIIFLALSGKMIFLKKIHRQMLFSSNVLKRWSFKKKRHWNRIFLVVLSGTMIFLSRKYYLIP